MIIAARIALLGSLLWATPIPAADGDPAGLPHALATLRQVGPLGQGHPEAVTAWRTVSQASAAQLTEILAGMDDANPLANNWIRAAVDTIAQRTLRAGDPLPLDALQAYLSDTSHSPRSRRLAFEWITRVDPAARQRLVGALLHDSSLELRRESVAAKLDEAEQALQQTRREDAIALYRVALDAARDLDQIQAIAGKLRDLGATVDLPGHLGSIMTWQLIGPFDNRGTAGFDRVYPPEQKIDLQQPCEGKEGTIVWQTYTTQDDYGMVNLNQAVGKHMGAVVYAVAFFDAEAPRPVELRLGCINANKLWLNGKLLTSNHVYHSGTSVDQYVARGELQPGTNIILLKICQNEQTESWAQDWEFQLRVCDHLGTAVRSQSPPTSQ